MSLFKIIKAHQAADRKLVKFSFEAFPEMTEPSHSANNEGFQPLFLVSPCQTKSTVEDPEPAVSPEGTAPPETGTALDAKELQQMLQESFGKGLAEGQQHAEKLFNDACRSLTSAVDEISGLKEKIVRESEEDLLRLTIMVAKQIIQREVSLDREILAQFVTEATRGIADQDEIIISFNPEDYWIISDKRHLYLAAIGDKRKITIKPDDSVPVGGCVVDTPTGLVDARVEAQLEEVFKQLMQERGHHSDGSLTLQMVPAPLLPEQSGVESYGYPKN
jgi:flagellar assembly protein FliH